MPGNKRPPPPAPAPNSNLVGAQERSHEVKLLKAGDDKRVVALCATLERKTFPKHESLFEGFEKEVRRRNALLFYCEDSAGAVKGYLIVSWRLPPAPRGGNIEKVCVAERFRRTGVGRALCEAALAAMRDKGALEVLLHVDPGRVRAVALYEALGFVRTGPLIEGYYNNIRDGQRMTLALD
uniref:N-acetyltransferase domain-containing protein n=2 Tax=Hemiselmis andersenii TaxID=464988 RepID=A0A6T8JDV4_HEMAN|mmetsp:Transcript_36885/g.86462  ORF Transcript_36885/g.86462 Transcript_36885/m.86462 type:complete len:181 (-) Transcript_36885:36-578(-)